MNDLNYYRNNKESWHELTYSKARSKARGKSGVIALKGLAIAFGYQHIY